MSRGTIDSALDRFIDPKHCRGYNNFIDETNISEGLNIFRFKGSATAGALRLDYLNPQTQEFTLPWTSPT